MTRNRQAITIKHVAADAGVSLQTVSRVINKGPNVRPDTLKRVQASIDKLGYVPSIAAQRMSGSRSYMIMALNDRERTISDWRAREGADWVDQMLLGGMLTSAKHGYRMIVELVDTHNDHVRGELGAAIAALQPDGVILTPPHSDNDVITSLLEERGICFTRIGSRRVESGIAVTMDDMGSARKATAHLLELGHLKIAMISGPGEYALSQRRIDGWCGAMEDAGLATDGLMVQGDFGYDSGLEAARVLLSRPDRPTAIIASSGQMALAAMKVARNMGLEVPRDLSLISFDNTSATRFTQPALTAIDQPIAEATSRAVELLIEQKKSGERPAEPVVIEAELIIRGSTAAPPVLDPGPDPVPDAVSTA